jgi:hypothetical protein
MRFGSALCLIDPADNLEVLEQAKAHYQEALHLMSARLPDEVQQARSKLLAVDETLTTKRMLTLGRPRIKSFEALRFETLQSLERRSIPSLPLPGNLFRR